MSNYYISKCCGEQVEINSSDDFVCSKCRVPCGVPKEEPAYIGGVNLTTNDDNEISSRLAVEDKLQTEFMEFWDEYKPKVGLGDYSDEITRFWFEKMEIQKAELLSVIKGLGCEADMDSLTIAKILNHLR
jgi:hypothetical protein